MHCFAFVLHMYKEGNLQMLVYIFQSVAFLYYLHCFLFLCRHCFTVFLMSFDRGSLLSLQRKMAILSIFHPQIMYILFLKRTTEAEVKTQQEMTIFHLFPPHIVMHSLILFITCKVFVFVLLTFFSVSPCSFPTKQLQPEKRMQHNQALWWLCSRMLVSLLVKVKLTPSLPL